MSIHRNMTLERILLALFVASGFAGLVYQSIWSHYLGLSLGHAAYAQTLVLAIFMGGMALGAWLVSRVGVRWQRLIFAYAVVELLIGAGGLLFHPLFVAYTAFSQETVYPVLTGENSVRAWQWGTAALLILPQSVLLGMTFPLMSAGYLRIAPRADGEILGGLYFTNSIGAAFGALFSTFVLLPRIGLPGTVAAAGIINLIVGVIAWRIAKRADVVNETVQPVPQTAEAAASAPAGDRVFFRVMLFSAGITGASSFVYEIGWVRLLNQALGTTVHSFELMLSAFILGLAFGGWWIRRRSRHISDPVAYAGFAQIFMGVAALVSIPVFGTSFYWVGAMVRALPSTDTGYSLFSLGSAAISLLVMFPAAFFAGMTLPLFTMAMLRKNAGETSIGRVYAANTLGAILGVILTVHVLIPLLGLRLALTSAALVDIGLGLFLLHTYATGGDRKKRIGILAVAAVIAAGSMMLGNLDPRALASGVFRNRQAKLGAESDVLYLKDGKTATISFVAYKTMGTIATNGKADASIEVSSNTAPTGDEITMVMAAALPLSVHTAPRTAAIIGWGSGLTTHSLLGSKQLTTVDSIEIERAMVEGARLYGKRVARGYTDPRSHIHIDDARTYFSTGRRRYDIIISEPSNPWVSGVASLFTQQFYGFLRGHLNEGGIAVQWLQSYELSDQLQSTMLAALISEFKYVDAYLTNSADLLFLASDSPLPELDIARIDGTDLRAEMKRVGLGGNGDFAVRKIGDKQVLAALVRLFRATPHSDYFPVVSLNAPRSRFKGENARTVLDLMNVGVPVLELTGGRKPASVADNVILDAASYGSIDHWNARDTLLAMQGKEVPLLRAREPAIIEYFDRLKKLSSSAIAATDVNDWLTYAAFAADFTIGYLPPQDLEGLWINPSWIESSAQPELVQSMLATFAATSRRDGKSMHEHATKTLRMFDEASPSFCKEQMLVIAMLGAIAAGNTAEVEALEKEFSAIARPTNESYTYARMYLRAWASVRLQN
jgi:spermidine synthase